MILIKGGTHVSKFHLRWMCDCRIPSCCGFYSPELWVLRLGRNGKGKSIRECVLNTTGTHTVLSYGTQPITRWVFRTQQQRECGLLMYSHSVHVEMFRCDWGSERNIIISSTSSLDIHTRTLTHTRPRQTGVCLCVKTVIYFKNIFEELFLWMERCCGLHRDSLLFLWLKLWWSENVD